MKTLPLITILILFAGTAQSQVTLTLDKCYDLAEAHYPLIRQRGLIKLSGEYRVTNASRGLLPRVSIAGQTTYQSEVTQIPVEMPGIQPLSKDQYRASVEVSQTLFEGGATSTQREIEKLGAITEAEQLEVELFHIRSRVNDLFFGILLLQDQVSLTELARVNLQAALAEVEASIANGVAIRSAGDALRAEILKVEQRLIEAQAALGSHAEMLSLFIGQPIPADATLARPALEIDRSDAPLIRPELRLFNAQRQVLEARKGLLSARKMPRIELFAQTGYGRPGLNMLENKFDFFYIGGLRFSWHLSAYYTSHREQEILRISQESIQVQEDAFRFNTNLEQRKESSEIAKLRRLIEVDDQLISLRGKVRETARVQLREGVITPADFIREANAEDQARQSRALHETQLLHALAKYQNTMGY